MKNTKHRIIAIIIVILLVLLGAFLIARQLSDGTDADLAGNGEVMEAPEELTDNLEVSFSTRTECESTTGALCTFVNCAVGTLNDCSGFQKGWRASYFEDETTCEGQTGRVCTQTTTGWYAESDADLAGFDLK